MLNRRSLLKGLVGGSAVGGCVAKSNAEAAPANEGEQFSRDEFKELDRDFVIVVFTLYIDFGTCCRLFSRSFGMYPHEILELSTRRVLRYSIAVPEHDHEEHQVTLKLSPTAILSDGVASFGVWKVNGVPFYELSYPSPEQAAHELSKFGFRPGDIVRVRRSASGGDKQRRQRRG